MRLAEWLGLQRNLRYLLAVILLVGAGEELWMRFLPKYLQVLGAAALIIGLFDALKTLLGAVYAYPGGVLVDRWGHRRALLAFNAVSILGYALVLLVPHWAAVILGMFLFLAWSNFSLPATFSLVGASLPAEQHAMGIGVQSLVKRAPILVGPILGGMFLDRCGVVGGMRIGLGASIVLGAIAIVLEQRIRDLIPDSSRNLPGFLGVVRDFDPRLRRLLFSDILIRFCERIPYAWIVIYALDHVGVSATAVGVLTAVEMAAAIACYLPAAYFADRYGKEPFVIATFVFFTLFPLTMLVARTFTLLLAAFVIRGLKEFGEPARKALIISYSPAGGTGRVVGAYYLIRDVVVSAGSFVGAVLWRIGPAANFAGAGALGAAGTLLYIATLRARNAAAQ